MSERRPDRAEQAPGTRPRIYVASLSDLMDNRLHGIWLDATQEADALSTGIAGMLARSPHSTVGGWVIFDHECFAGVTIEGHPDVDTIALLANGITNFGAPFAAWAKFLGPAGWSQLEHFEARYIGHYASPTEFAKTWLTDDGDLSPDPIVRLDPSAFACDLEMSGVVDIIDDESGGGVYVFFSPYP